MQRIDGENWLRLQLAARSYTQLRHAALHFGSATALLEQDPDELYESKIIYKKTAERLKEVRSDKTKKLVDETVELCRRNGWRIITPQSPYYPKELLKLSRFPFVLYALGDPELLKAKTKCSIVGTRASTQNARVIGYKLGYALSLSGAVVVSGGALGVDAASHEGALAGSTGTIAVLGAGLAGKYLKQNEDLRKRIASNGLLITEMNPFEGATKFNFPERNRIIAMLGDACCVIESKISGGSLITADIAYENKKPIFVPSFFINPSPGCRKLAAEKGAIQFEKPAEILQYISSNRGEVCDVESLPKEALRTVGPDYNVDFALPGLKSFILGKEDTQTERSSLNGSNNSGSSAEKNKDGGEKPDFLSALPVSETERIVLRALSDKPLAVDKIVEKTRLGADEVVSSLTLLELRGTVKSYYGNSYSLNIDPA